MNTGFAPFLCNEVLLKNLVIICTVVHIIVHTFFQNIIKFDWDRHNEIQYLTSGGIRASGGGIYKKGK